MAKYTERAISVDGLLAAMQQYGKEFVDATNKDVQSACKEVGSEIVSELKTTSPKDTGKYARNWRYTLETGDKWSRAIVHDSVYQLVHLLEYGHALKGGGRTQPQPHVEPAQTKADSLFINTLKKKIEAGE